MEFLYRLNSMKNGEVWERLGQLDSSLASAESRDYGSSIAVERRYVGVKKTIG